MKCPYCQEPQNRVIDSRLSKDGTVIRRRRECAGCLRRFTTYERVEENMPMVVKRGGVREVFNSQKILAGVKKACEKRPVSMGQIEQLVENLERELQESGQSEVPSSYIGERVLEGLRGIDGVAYVRFVSVYRDFRDVDEFLDELQQLLASRGGR